MYISIISRKSNLLLKLEEKRQQHREKIGKRNRKSEALATGSHPLRSHFLSQPGRSTGFSPLERERRGKTALPSSLPRFISIFLRAFCVQFHLASLPRHVLFLFPRLSLCHSQSRRTRSSCFTLPPSLFSSSFASLPPSFFSLLSPLNSYPPPLSVSSPFSPISRPSSFRLPHRPSSSFFLSLGRFVASSTTLLSPPSTPLPVLSLFRCARWFHLLIPSSPHA